MSAPGGEIAQLKEAACKAIEDASEELGRLSQGIWSHPETAYKEHYAHKLLTDYLENNGFDVKRGHIVDTGFAAKPSGSDEARPNIAMLCEYDALPEVDHGCGHNLIAEVGIAAGLGIKAALEKASFNHGQLTVYGTPAEEEGGGKVDFIRAGAFKDIDVAMMSHPSRYSTPYARSLAMTEVYVTYHGKESHASAFPWEGVNALDAAVMAYNSLSCMRQQVRPKWRIHGIIKRGGVKPNIIPGETELHYYLRTPSATELQQLIEKGKQCFEGAATATGCTVSYKWDEKPYENVINNNTMVKLYEENASKLGVNTFTDPAILDKSAGSTDMGNVTHVVPGIHPVFAIPTKDSAHTHAFCTAAGSPESQPVAIREGKILACTAIDIYCQPELLQQIKEDFQQDLQKEQSMV